MKKQTKGFSPIIIVMFILALGIIGFLIYQNIQLKKNIPGVSETLAPTAVPSVSPIATPVATATPNSNLKPGWQMYTNTQYGFELAHPASYKELTSKQDLYGWEDAILLLYKGGQSYDLAIEVWNTEADYKAKYVNTSDLTVFKTGGGKFITLFNANKDPEVAEIVSTFKFTQ